MLELPPSFTLLICAALCAPTEAQTPATPGSQPPAAAPKPSAPKPATPETKPTGEPQGDAIGKAPAPDQAAPAPEQPTGASAELRKKGWLLDAQGLALQGYDPLSYFEPTGPQLGKAEFTSTFRGVTYRFTTKANKERFDQDPQRHEPPYGGWCAYAVIDGDKVEVDPRNYRVIDGKVYLFYKGFFGDAGNKWDALVTKSTAAQIVQKADAGWRAIERKDQAAVDKEARTKAKPKK